MGVEPWFNVQKDIPRRLLAQILSAYYGGRSEVRIRREIAAGRTLRFSVDVPE
jgi:hypothetical protein